KRRRECKPEFSGAENRTRGNHRTSKPAIESSVGLNQVHERAHRDTRGAFGEPGLRVIVPGGASNVQVNPRRIAREFADEPRAGDLAFVFATAYILNFGKAAFY